MSRLQHFAYPHGGGWCVCYLVPNSCVMHVVCTCKSFADARGEAARLNEETRA